MQKTKLLNIVIVGAGQLGSRHLQALTSLNQDLSIYLIDPSSDALAKAVELFNKFNVLQNKSIHTHQFIEQLEIEKIDVAIIATNSLVRRNVIEKLVAKCAVKYMILEKFLFPATEDYQIIEQLVRSENIKTWVNCPRRMFDIYKDLKKEMKEYSSISVKGSLWGLGCNGIHMLDLIAYLTGEKEFILDGNRLDNEIIKSKREGFIEFTGTISGETKSQKHTFTLSSLNSEGIPFIISVKTGKKIFIIEAEKKLKIFHVSNDKQIEEKPINIPFQSQLSNIVIEQLINTGNCSLTLYEESSQLHIQYLKVLLEVLQKQSQKKVEKCLIT